LPVDGGYLASGMQQTASLSVWLWFKPTLE